MRRVEELKNRNVVFYGSGSMSYRVKNILNKYDISPVAVVDSNQDKWGKQWVDGLKIISYEELKKKFDDYIIVMTVAINNAISIREQLEASGESNPIIHMQCPFKVDDELLEDDNLFEDLSGLFSDELSMSIFRDFIGYKSSGDMEGLIKYLDGDTFFDTKIIEKRSNHSYVDVGCYTGDTILKFLMFCNNSYNQIVGMEADPGISRAAKKFIDLGRIKNAQIINKGGWNEYKRMEFQTVKNNETTLFDSPNLFKSASEIIEVKFMDIIDEDIYETVEIECDSLDNLVADIHPTLIKINALAADLPILEGALNIVREDRPYLMFDYGARPSYVRKTLEVLKMNCLNYSYYLRVKEIFGDYKTVLYAVPEII